LWHDDQISAFSGLRLSNTRAINLRKERREERKREKWMVVGDTTVGERKRNLSSVLKVPRHCPLVLPVRIKQLTGIIDV
jgi:hypothetical protein